jgi:hypothetical protein
VVVPERDVLPVTGESRKGVPQGRHAHGILPRGMEVLDELFPGLQRQLTAGGAQVVDYPGGMRFFVSGHPLARVSTGVPVILMSRPFLEGHVRERVRDLPNVEFVEGCDVRGLAATGDRRRVTGVRVVRRRAGGTETVMSADLVVDATGRVGRAPVWLQELGYRRPPEEQVRIGVGYASCYLRRRPEALDGDKFVLVNAQPGRPRGMALFAVEGDRWILTLTGYHDGNRPPGDPDGFWSLMA